MAALLCAAAAYAVAVGAQDVPPDASPLYDVELIVFRNLQAHGSQEVAAPPATDPAADPAAVTTVVPDVEPREIEPAAAPPLPEFVTELPPERHALDNIEGALKRSAGYRPLAHVGWSQPGSPRGGAPTVPLSELLAGTGLDGTARLSVGRYLHLDLNLEYRGDDGFVRTLTQSRRMRSGERHYFDDPLFGVIAVVTRRDGSG